MLNSIRQAIEELPEINFPEFYQEYVKESQDAIINRNVKSAISQYSGIEDSCKIIQGLNTLTEELKTLW